MSTEVLTSRKLRVRINELLAAPSNKAFFTEATKVAELINGLRQIKT